MSGVAVIKHLLWGYGPLTALVPTTNIKAGVLPQYTNPPAIGITEVSGAIRNVWGRSIASKHVRERVQVSVKATNYPEQKEILKKIIEACDDSFGTIAGYSNVAVLAEREGPDMSDAQAGFFVQSFDFMVSFTQVR